ncbi:MAG: Hsp20/alpha crystallin family protein [Firmicutes bacterium HGW-Firmicutes-1]|jgi:HSP20 family protein|nr:MAG: Hsp20/alpha crystallin family protein [Firmicutes bacterium HGW-Firmicutes-1]
MFGLSTMKRNDLANNNNFWDIDKFFDGFFDEPFLPYLNSRYGSMHIDIKEDPDSYSIIAEVPGIKKDELKIGIDRDVLTIAVERKEEVNEENESFVRKERRAVNMQRSFRLDNVKADEINAKLEEGILTLTLPKVQLVHSTVKNIEIQ